MTEGTNILEKLTALRLLTGFEQFTMQRVPKPINSRTLRRAIEENGRTARQRLALQLAEEYYQSLVKVNAKSS
jgi:hypothetical protein